MSWRHPAHNSKSTAADREIPRRFAPRFTKNVLRERNDAGIELFRTLLRLNFGQLARRQSLQELPGLLPVEQRIVRLNAKKKPVAGGQRQSGPVEDGGGRRCA